MTPDIGAKVIAVAKGLIGCHYINGAYGATPGREDGCPCRPGGIKLVADANRLNPARVNPAEINLAVFAAEMNIKTHCICAGNYTVPPVGQLISTHTDPELTAYLGSLKGKPPASWPTFKNNFTPRRAFGPGPGGDLGGLLVWGQSCKGIRHFDCVGFISYCYWKATGNVVQLDIKAWRNPDQVGTVYDLRPQKPRKDGTIPVVPKPGRLQDGDILIKADHHIGFVTAGGVIYQAEDTHLGVRSSGGFNSDKPGDWTHLTRLGTAPIAPAPDWPLGWWKVWDGKTYYYYFGDDGVVKSTKTLPTNTRTPPKVASNVGNYTLVPPKLVITWKKVAGAATNCIESFYNATKDCQEMNANSNLYGPLVAKRLETTTP